MTRNFSLLRGNLVTVAVAAMLAASAFGVHAQSLSPNPAPVTAGSSVDVTLTDTINDPTDVLAIAAIDLTVTFDSTLLSLTNVTDGSLLTSLSWDPAVFNGTTGSISISEGLAANDLNGSGGIVVLTFTALSTDPTTTTPISIATSTASVGAPEEYQLPSTSGSVSITALPPVNTPIPAPGVGALLLPALALIRLRARKA